MRAGGRSGVHACGRACVFVWCTHMCVLHIAVLVVVVVRVSNWSAAFVQKSRTSASVTHSNAVIDTTVKSVIILTGTRVITNRFARAQTQQNTIYQN